MDARTRHVAAQAMLAHGSAFVRGLAHALASANAPEARRLWAAFPELLEQYGPGSEPFAFFTAAHAQGDELGGRGQARARRRAAR